MNKKQREQVYRLNRNRVIVAIAQNNNADPNTLLDLYQALAKHAQQPETIIEYPLLDMEISTAYCVANDELQRWIWGDTFDYQRIGGASFVNYELDKLSVDTLVPRGALTAITIDF